MRGAWEEPVLRFLCGGLELCLPWVAEQFEALPKPRFPLVFPNTDDLVTDGLDTDGLFTGCPLQQ